MRGSPTIGNPHPFDRVGEDRDGTRDLFCGAEGATKDLHVVATEIRDEHRQLGVIPLVEERAGEGRPYGRGGGAQEELVFLVRHVVEPLTQIIPARHREGLLETPTVLRLEHLPAVVAEHGFELSHADTGDDAVERLAIEVDDPDNVVEAGERGLRDGLPDGSFVQLAVPDERDIAPSRAGGESIADEAFDQRGVVRRDGA